jgi:hypothetical protein
MRDLGQDRREKSEGWSDVSLAVDLLELVLLIHPMALILDYSDEADRRQSRMEHSV